MIARQVAESVLQLQLIQLNQAGPLGGGLSQGRFLTDYSAGPFESGQEKGNWSNHKLDMQALPLGADYSTISLHVDSGQV